MARQKMTFLKGMGGTISKYHSKKVEIDGIKFDSIKESKRYQELKLLEKAKLISKLELQKKFELQPSFKKNGKTFRSISYIADFYYYDNQQKKYIVEDVKGFETDVFKIKRKIFEYKYQDLELILL